VAVNFGVMVDRLITESSIKRISDQNDRYSIGAIIEYRLNAYLSRNFYLGTFGHFQIPALSVLYVRRPTISNFKICSVMSATVQIFKFTGAVQNQAISKGFEYRWALSRRGPSLIGYL
jgi:hypothetical protein